jgi:hypothetical protein
MHRPLLALVLAAATPALADDRAPPPAAVSYGVHADAPTPSFEPRQRVQQAGARAKAPAVIVVRGKRSDAFLSPASMGPDFELIQALAQICRPDPRDPGPIAASLRGETVLPAGF